MSPTERDTHNVIRITQEQVDSAHVDDLLKRQMSLRGEAGITRDRKHAWYYQNWFIFMIAGALSALVAWAIIDPHFQDAIYWQGTITSSGLISLPLGGKSNPATVPSTGPSILLGLPSIDINGQQIYLSPHTRVVMPDGSYSDLTKIASPKVGDRIGVYLRDRVRKSFLAPAPTPEALWMVLKPDPARDTPATTTLGSLETGKSVAAALLFPLVAALVGMGIGASDGIICRVWRRIFLSGAIGLVCGFVGGFISLLAGALLYHVVHGLAMQSMTSGHLTAGGFTLQVMGRGLAWAVAGMAMGLGQGIALRSPRLLLYGCLGGVLGGLIGGLLFDPIDLIFLGDKPPSARWARLTGLTVIGACTGLMIGIVELLARDAWLRMTEGPLAGKEFLIFKDIMRMGSSPKSEIYLFNDPEVAPEHAVLRAVGDNYEIENAEPARPVRVNGRPITTARLRHGDQIAIGRTLFVFNRQRTT